MRVILQERVANLGNVGDVVTVKPGFARNFLVPYGKAVQATEESIKEFETRRAEFEKREAEKMDAAKSRAETLAEKTVTLKAKASDEGKLFGSIAARDIADAVVAIGIELNKAEVNLPEGPIRLTGEYEVAVTLYGDVQSTVKVVVEAE